MLAYEQLCQDNVFFVEVTKNQRIANVVKHYNSTLLINSYYYDFSLNMYKRLRLYLITRFKLNIYQSYIFNFL
jgi:hypothetical protein